MLGIPVSGPSYIYGDNMPIIHNSSKPESTLKKKCNANTYYAVHIFVAMRESLKGHIRVENNPANLQTKVVTGQKRKNLVPLVLKDIYDGNT